MPISSCCLAAALVTAATATATATGSFSVVTTRSAGSECCDPKMERMENTTAVVNITATAAAGRRTDFIMLVDNYFCFVSLLDLERFFRTGKSSFEMAINSKSVKGKRKERARCQAYRCMMVSAHDWALYSASNYCSFSRRIHSDRKSLSCHANTLGRYRCMMMSAHDWASFFTDKSRSFEMAGKEERAAVKPIGV
jgi:hypothetical protein